MKKIISFDKNLEFNSIIGSISSISFDHTLKFTDKSNIKGEFLISGSYTLTEASRIEDKFSFKVPIEIILNECLDLESTKIDIEDFTYHLENNDTLICHIEVKIEGIEEISIEENIENLEKEELVLERECDNDIKTNVVNNPEEEIKEIEYDDYNNTNEKEEVSTVGSLFSSFKDSDETFATYSVYIMRNNDNLEKIMTKYNIGKEELEDYNDLEKIDTGSKIIIPTINEKT